MSKLADNARLTDTLEERAVGQEAGGNEVHTHFDLGPDDELSGCPGTVDERTLPKECCEAHNRGYKTSIAKRQSVGMHR